MTESEAFDWLCGLAKFRVDRYNLNGISRLVGCLGHPEKFLKYVHIAGTNGKGSVARFCSGALMQAGYKTGLFVSPHIVSFNERIQINGEFIKTSELVNLIELVRPKVERLQASKVFCSQFDVITAMAFQHFKNNGCDFVVLEAGMGGRLDSTNVISTAEVAIITKISFDHEKELGNTLTKIAFEKAGIIKKGSLCVCSAFEPLEVVDVLKKVCVEKQAKFLMAPRACNVVCGVNGNQFEFDGNFFETGLGGVHQVENAMIAITALKQLKVSVEHVQLAIKQAVWPARFETFFNLSPKFILDGAHNVDGFCALAGSLRLCKIEPKVGVVSMLNRKNYDEALREVKNMGFSKVVLTQMGCDDAVDVAELQRCACKHNLNYVVEQDWHRALNLAASLASKRGVVVVFGSLYFCAMVRSELSF